jgi:plastocyanin
MKPSELLARIIIVTAIIAVIATPLWIWIHTPLIHAHVAENGGWTPNILQAKVGVPLHLHLTSDDVTHGFAVGQQKMQSVDILPGKVTNLTLTFDKPGTYTFYCTRWCGLNHWRMRGTIEVTGGTALSTPAAPPLYVTLGLNIDAPHPASILPVVQPSAVRGTLLATQLPQNFSNKSYFTVDYYRSHSPAQAFGDLRADPALKSLSDAEVWDLVAFIWQFNLTPLELAYGGRLYAQNCEACHGQTMEGNGTFAEKLAAEGPPMKKPANLGDTTSMLGASPALFEGKVMRGGMGTGMPSWGPIFNEEQIWNLVAYLYSFQFEYQKGGGSMSKKHRRQKQRSFPWVLVAFGLVLIVVAFVFFATRSGSGSDGSGMPKIAVNPQKIDYSYIQFGNDKTFTINVTNTGDGVLRFNEKPYIEVLEGC